MATTLRLTGLNGTVLGDLPVPRSVTLQEELNAVGQLTAEYPQDGPFRSLLDSDVALIAVVKDGVVPAGR
jgi:hypothetical protein